VYVKRDDLSSPIYGGNKVRTLEVLFGDALQKGMTEVVASGAFGSNHAVATVLHGPRLGLRSGALLCPQPNSEAAWANLRVTAALARPFVTLPHWCWVPWTLHEFRRRHPCALVMPPGGASPLGALGYVSAAFELAEQVRSGLLPNPERIVLPIGSTCTSAGLLVGLRLARALGLGFESRLPQVYAVRVTPWPITSAWRTAHLAWRAGQLLSAYAGSELPAFGLSELRAGLCVDGHFLGKGYGWPSAEGSEARERLGAFGQTLDSTYSEKAAAALLRVAARTRGPVLFWATKSSAPLPVVDDAQLPELSSNARRWLTQGSKPSSLR
jgi:D-cysteine desulfhydrase